MLPGGTDPLYRSILAAGHRHFVRIDVYSGTGVLLHEDLPFFNGSLRATLASRVTREVTLTVHPDLYPVNPATALLNPYGHLLKIFRGVQLGDGSTGYSWQVFQGRIQRTTLSSASGYLNVLASDLSTDVIDNGFVTPQNSQPVNSVTEEFARLITDALPDAQFGVSDDFATPVQPLTWQFDRGMGLDELADSVGAYWYALADGSFVLRRYPWTVQSDPVVTLSDGSGGTVQEFECSRDRRDVFNVVTVTGERLNGDAPVHATAQDVNPTSPTYINGGFGVRSLLERLQTPATTGGAQGAARALLQDSIAPVETWRLEISPDAAMELGDVVQLNVNGRDVRQVVSDFVLPLDLSGNMIVQTRSQVINRLEVA